MEYQNLLIDANKEENPLIRVALIAAFAIAQFTTNEN